MRVPPVKNRRFVNFKAYEGVPEMGLIEFTEDYMTWVASKISGDAGVLRAKLIQMPNWFIHLGYAS